MVILGLDEVGRGSWAGPLVVGAVILDSRLRGLKDSKLLTRLARENLASKIETNCLAYSLGWVESEEIDEKGLSLGLSLAMERALAGIKAAYDEIIIDGQFNCLKTNPKARAIIKADNTVACVSAASIIAKVARDNYMRQMAKVYPHYGFDTNMGYGTEYHRAQIKLHGICKLHRLSFKPLKAYA